MRHFAKGFLIYAIINRNPEEADVPDEKEEGNQP